MVAEGRSGPEQRSVWEWIVGTLSKCVCVMHMRVCVCEGIHGSLWRGRTKKLPLGTERLSSLELSLGLALSLSPNFPPKDEKFYSPPLRHRALV